MIKKYVVIWLLIGHTLALQASEQKMQPFAIVGSVQKLLHVVANYSLQVVTNYGLHYAIQNGDTKTIKKYVNNKWCDVNYVYFDSVNSTGHSLLHEAIWQHNVELARFLLEKKVDLEVKHGYWLWAPLRLAIELALARDTDCDIIDMLLQAGAHVDAQGRLSDDVLLHRVVETRRSDILLRLVDAGAYVNVQNRYGITPLSWALHCGNKKKNVAMLLAAGADTTLADSKGVTPLKLGNKCSTGLQQHVACHALQDSVL